MSSEVALVDKKSKKATTSAVDNSSDSQPPVDFSFLVKITDKNRTVDALMDQEPNMPPKRTIPVDDSGKWLSHGLKLNNNYLEDIKSLPEFVSKKIANPQLVRWIDLSFNDLKTIDEALLEFPALMILNLHGNQIESAEEIEKLTKLKNLKKLTLHGNPLGRAGAKNANVINGDMVYKHHVIDNCPNLRSLDCTGITKHNRKTAETLMKMKPKKNKKKDMGDDDD